MSINQDILGYKTSVNNVKGLRSIYRKCNLTATELNWKSLTEIYLNIWKLNNTTKTLVNSVVQRKKSQGS